MRGSLHSGLEEVPLIRKAQKYMDIAKSIDDSLPAYSRQAEQGAGNLAHISAFQLTVRFRGHCL